MSGTAYILYRFTGAVSYLNYFDHVQYINKMVAKYARPQKIPILLSFRYSQIIDEESLEELSLYIEQLRNSEGVEVILTGLHRKLMEDMEGIEYFRTMQHEGAKGVGPNIEQQADVMYSLEID